MAPRPLTVILAAAIVVGASAGAPSLPASAAVPSAEQSTLVKRVLTDVDGDGTRDTVKLKYLGSEQFELTVTTTKGKTSAVTFTRELESLPDSERDAWYGASEMDGRKGSELAVRVGSNDSTDTTIGVYTWRSGKLVAEAAPATPKGARWVINEDRFTRAYGYTFFTKSGRRYVDASSLTTTTTTPWRGKVTRSVWRKDKWVRVSTRTATSTKSLTKLGQVGLGGPQLLRHTMRVDLNGDGKLDLVRVYATNSLDRYQVKATVKGASRTVSYTGDGSDGFLGAGTVDGKAGTELLFQTNFGDPEWRVFTWRDGKLTSLRSPIPDAGSVFWPGGGEGMMTYIDATVEAGKHHVSFTYAEIDSMPEGNQKKWVWQGSSWTQVSDWSAVIITDDYESGFTTADFAGTWG